MLRKAVLSWYDAHGRMLPWRKSADPYRIWISEIMLQQTTVAAVVPYFERFVSRFPNVAALAAADQSEVLHAWEGLGYYTRARNLHKAANVIVQQFGGQFPHSLPELLKLPGVGRYTAGAIASFAFQLPAPIVEANTARLYARLIGLRAPLQTAAAQRALWSFAETLVSFDAPRTDSAGERPADLNQALMDLGSSVCRPVQPDCLRCPVAIHCAACKTELQDQIPAPKPRPVFTQLYEVAIALRKGNRWLLRQCGDDERWTGLWDFVRIEVTEDDFAKLDVPDIQSHRSSSQTRAPADAPRQKQLFPTQSAARRLLLPQDWNERVVAMTGLTAANPRFVSWIRHTVTRYHIQLLCLQAEAGEGRIRRTANCDWFTREELAKLPLSTTGRRLARQVVAAPQRGSAADV